MMHNEVKLIDCMEFMKTVPDKYYELAIVDPPYGVGTITYMPRERKKAFGGYIDTYEITMATIDINQRANTKVNVVNSHNSKSTISNFGDTNVNPLPEYFEELFRISKNQIIWGGNYFILPPSRGFCIWRKLTISESFSMAMCEYAWMSFNTNAKLFECAPQGTSKDKRFHPTQKPIELYKWLLKNYAKPNDKIFDSHVGSGSIRIACHDMGFDFEGCEIDKDYWKAQEERYKSHIMQGDLFSGSELQSSILEALS